MPAAKEGSLKILGVIAGGGMLPQVLVHACDQKGIEPFVVAFEGQTDPAVTKGRRHIMTRIGAAGRTIRTLKSHGVKDLVMIGSIRRPTLAELRPDITTTAFFAKLGLRALGDDNLLGAVRRMLESEGFELHGVQDFVADLTTAPGPLGRYKPDRTDQDDIARGVEVASMLGRLDVGQSVVVQEGIVLGVEAVEGTDELLRRCAGLKRKGSGGVLVKICKPQQDRKFDLPTVGPDTVREAIRAGLSGIAVQAGQSLMLDPQEMAKIADAGKIFVTGIDVD